MRPGLRPFITVRDFTVSGAGGGSVDPEGRVTLNGAESLGFSAHSFLYQAVAPGDFGNLGAYWTGDLHIAYAEFSSLRQRWDANGVDRTADYDGALIVTEIGDLETGLADPASAQGIETLQTLFWYALTAQAKGCKLLGIYIPHSPEGVNIDADALAKVQYWLDWLRARPEITIPVYAIPAPVMVRAMIDQFAPTSIYADGLHLKTPVYVAPNQMNNAMGQMVRMFLTGARPADGPAWNAELIGLVDTAWGILQDYEMTGLGGDTVVAPYPVAADPLPSPEPLPGHPLQAYYDSGTIGIHHLSEGATPAGGPVTALANRGGAGAVFNATVSGAAIPLSGNYLQMSATSGMPTMANPVNLVGVRLMWVMQIASYVNGTRLFGGAVSSPYGFEVRINSNGSGQLAQLWSNASGTGVSVNLGTRATWPTTPMLVEVEVGASSATIYINGVSSGSGSHAWAQFLVENLGKGQVSGAVPLEGLMGDVIGVVTGRGDTVAAIAAARAYLDDRFALGLA